MSEPLPETPRDDSEVVPETIPPAVEAAPPPAETVQRRRDPLPFLIVFGIIVLCGAAVFLWQHPLGGGHVAETRRPATVAAAEPLPSNPPPAAPPAPATPPQTASVDPAQVAALAQQVDALSKQTGALSDLAARVTALEKQPAAAAGANDALTGQLSQLAAQQSQQGQTVTTLAAQVTALQSRVDGFTQAASRIVRIARIEAAGSALALGQPLGDIDGAPAAVARYSTAAPPTEAALRLQFPALAAEAEAASRPRTDQLPLWEAVKLKAEQLVVVRRGDRVLVGDPDAGIIARAEAAVAAGDLPTAIAALDALQGPPAAIVADWKTRASNLLAAKKALAAMAAAA